MYCCRYESRGYLGILLNCQESAHLCSNVVYTGLLLQGSVVVELVLERTKLEVVMIEIMLVYVSD